MTEKDDELDDGIDVDLNPTRAVAGQEAIAFAQAQATPFRSMPVTAPVEGPQRLGRYTLLGLLGKGGMAEVYLAKQDGPMGFAKTCVVKRIRRSLAEEARFVEMFLREARVAARLNHPNAVQIFELGQDGHEYFLAMEFLDGVSLHRAARRTWHHGESVPMEVALRCVADAALGLHHAHTLVNAEGRMTPLVHRDVSPDNIMLTRDGVSKVLDFGIAKSTEVDEQTGTGEVKGKIPFMSPEQLQGHDLDARSDLWSLGVTMYWLLTGKRPFDASSEPMTIDAILRKDPVPPREVNPLIPVAVESIVMDLLHKEKTKRIPSGNALHELILGMLGPAAGYAAASTFAAKAMAWEDADPKQPLSALTVLAARPESQWLKRLDESNASLQRLFPESTPSEARPPMRTRVPTDPSMVAFGTGTGTGSRPRVQTDPGRAVEGPPSTGKTVTGLRAIETSSSKSLMAIPIAAGILAATVLAIVAYVAVFRGKEKPGVIVDSRAVVVDEKPVDAKPVVDQKPVDAKPVEPKPVEPKAVEEKPVDDKKVEKADKKVAAPDTRPSVKIVGPGRISWKAGKVSLGKGAQTTKVPKGTDKLIAFDGETGGTSTVPIVNGVADYGALGTGTVQVRVKPWADVELGSRKLGTTPIDPLTLTAGKYTLKFVREGMTKTATVEVKKDQTSTVTMDLRD